MRIHATKFEKGEKIAMFSYSFGFIKYRSTRIYLDDYSYEDHKWECDDDENH